jgi:hypothetical protein
VATRRLQCEPLESPTLPVRIVDAWATCRKRQQRVASCARLGLEGRQP